MCSLPCCRRAAAGSSDQPLTWRAADQQGDISQARGMLGQLLFEFGQLELNRDLLEAIKRTESRTGVLPCCWRRIGNLLSIVQAAISL